MPILEIEIDGSTVQRLPVGDGPLIVGSDPSCQVRIDDRAVARRHLRISLEWTVEDLSSDHLAYLGSRKITRDWLRFGDVVEIGPSRNVRVRLKASSGDDLPDDVEALQQRVRDLEAERAALEAEVNSLETRLRAEQAKNAASAAVLTDERARHWVETLDLTDGPSAEELDALGAEGIEERLRMTLQLLLDFALGLEKMTERALRAASGRAGASPFERQNIKQQISRALRAQTPDAGQQLVADQLDRMTKTWVTASLKVYRQGVEIWAQDFLNRLAPKTIQIRAGVSETKLDLGLGYRKLWNVYRRFILELTSEILVEEVDEEVQKTVRSIK